MTDKSTDAAASVSPQGAPAPDPLNVDLARENDRLRQVEADLQMKLAAVTAQRDAYADATPSGSTSEETKG